VIAATGHKHHLRAVPLSLETGKNLPTLHHDPGVVQQLMVLHIHAAFYIIFYVALIYSGAGQKYGQTKGEDTGNLSVLF